MARSRVSLISRARKQLWRLRHSHVLRRRLILRVASMLILISVVFSCAMTFRAGRTLQQSWGETTTVLRFSEDVAAGEPVTAQVVEPVRVPTQLAPQTAVRELPEMSRTTSRVSVGEFVTLERITHSNSSSLAQQVPAGHSVVAISYPVQTVALSPGDVISLFDTSRTSTDMWGDPNPRHSLDRSNRDWSNHANSTAPQESQLIADQLPVVSVNEELSHLIVSVPNADVPLITGVIAHGQFTVVLHGSAQPRCEQPERC